MECSFKITNLRVCRCASAQSIHAPPIVRRHGGTPKLKLPNHGRRHPRPGRRPTSDRQHERSIRGRRQPYPPITALPCQVATYDNLGFSVLEPGRSAAHTAHAYDVDYIIACDAGRGRLPLASGHFAGARLQRSFEIVHRRAQDASRGRLHEAAAAGLIDGFVHAYLGMPDERLPIPVCDLVPADRVRNYPTDFRAVSESDLHALSLRGEQLTSSLLSHYCPDL
jgi:hypothetical protein